MGTRVLQFGSIKKIFLPNEAKETIIEHCQRKLAKEFISGEAQEQKAYGLVAGNLENNTVRVKTCQPLLKNARCLMIFIPPLVDHALATINIRIKKNMVSPMDQLV